MARVLLTGASSFTGYWFAKSLAQAGHELLLTFTGEPSAYHEFPRDVRVQFLRTNFRCEHECAFGSDRFLGLLKANAFDVVCLHGATVGDFRNPRFPVVEAVSKNVFRLQEALDLHQGALVVTGSYFERGQGGHIQNEPASAYGLAKSLTTEVVRFYALQKGCPFGHFVIPNPFGPFEDKRYTSYLVSQWLQDKKAILRYPKYLRDNIHVSTLSEHYASAVGELVPHGGIRQWAPGQYRETQLRFTQRFSKEMRPLLKRKCEFEVRDETLYAEPLRRHNQTRVTDPLENQRWRELGEYYLRFFVGSEQAR